jgi:hypothetical protein
MFMSTKANGFTICQDMLAFPFKLYLAPIFRQGLYCKQVCLQRSNKMDVGEIGIEQGWVRFLPTCFNNSYSFDRQQAIIAKEDGTTTLDKCGKCILVWTYLLWGPESTYQVPPILNLCDLANTRVQLDIAFSSLSPLFWFLRSLIIDLLSGWSD